MVRLSRFMDGISRACLGLTQSVTYMTPNTAGLVSQTRVWPPVISSSSNCHPTDQMNVVWCNHRPWLWSGRGLKPKFLYRPRQWQ